jgi:uncharacterized protein YbcC (UPF0753/DUF2309 family)
MTATIPAPSRTDVTVSDELRAAVNAACARIAPTWPLDRMIAVNPYWGFVHQPMEDAAAAIGALMGSPMLMSTSWYQARLGAAAPAPDAPQSHDIASFRRKMFTDLADAARDLTHNASWNDFVVQHVSRSCAAFFDEGQAQWRPAAEQGLYALWRELSRADAGPQRMMGLHGFRDGVASLPRAASALIALALHELAVPVSSYTDYCTALLLSVNGWAAACAFRRWDARLAGGDDDTLVDLLTIRLAWELVLFRCAAIPERDAKWKRAMHEWAHAEERIRVAQASDWQLQRTLERAYRQTLVQQLTGTRAATSRTTTQVQVQAVFCIDVRSEVFRRALEAAAPSVRTLGFAGFFGAPIAYESITGARRAQLPGLLAPALLVSDEGVDRANRATSIRDALAQARTIGELGQLASSAFSFVEATGLSGLASLARRTLGLGTSDSDAMRSGLDAASSPLKPRITSRADGQSLDREASVTLAAGVLTGMSLTSEFAPIMALIGHGAATCNNPQAAGLACGACGGQSGEVNARVMAALLNDRGVREGLRGRGIDLTSATHVVAGLHDTTTDDVQLYDLDEVPPTHTQAVADFAESLRAAGARARAERAPSLGIGVTDDRRLRAAMTARTADWSEVRAEWGLARNAAFIVAPRERTAGLNLAGRSFLHEYRPERDHDGAVLEAIMTAPMIVTHWINLQYYASTVDNARFGSGDKVLHNVAGANQGVFEGAAGDLRIGLALQSVHDGRDWYHEPLRLNVFLEAPADRIDGIIARHELVQHLVHNGWLQLFRIDAHTGAVEQRTREGWQATS